MKQLQLHEYLALVDGGAPTIPVEQSLADEALKQAEALWPDLRIDTWEKRKRKVECVAQCSNGTRLVHVTANRRNCFLILVVPPKKKAATKYLLFEIGAEYAEPQLICPAFDLDGPADKVTIRKIIPRLDGQRNPFAILNIGNGTYIQCYAEVGLYDVEHQVVSTAAHYSLKKKADAATVVKLFLSYGFGKKEWATEYEWKLMKL